MRFKIREATPADIDEIINLCAEHADYEQAAYSREGKEEKLAAYMFAEKPSIFCLIAEDDSGIIGYATYSFEFSTWDAGFYTHMDCLYLRPHARGGGIGEAMVKEIAQRSTKAGMELIQWQTPAFNERAIKFYHRIGAKSKEKLRLYYSCK